MDNMCTCQPKLQNAGESIQAYQNTLNHSNVTPSADLDDFADSATRPLQMQQSRKMQAIPMLHEVTRAIRRLKNGRAAGADGVTAELLKGAEKPISEALHKVITNVWSTGRVPTEWKEGIIVSLYKGKGSQSECSIYRPISFVCIGKSICTYPSGAHCLQAYLTSAADLNSLVLLPGGLLWMPYQP